MALTIQLGKDSLSGGLTTTSDQPDTAKLEMEAQLLECAAAGRDPLQK